MIFWDVGQVGFAIKRHKNVYLKIVISERSNIQFLAVKWLQK
jgi:hypothetical protein